MGVSTVLCVGNFFNQSSLHSIMVQFFHLQCVPTAAMILSLFHYSSSTDFTFVMSVNADADYYQKSSKMIHAHILV